MYRYQAPGRSTSTRPRYHGVTMAWGTWYQPVASTVPGTSNWAGPQAGIQRQKYKGLVGHHQFSIGITNIIGAVLMSHASFLHSFGNSSTATRQLAQEGTTAEDPAIDHFELICDRIPIENFARSIVFRCTHCFYGLSSLEFNVGEARLHLSTCGECKTTDPNLCRRFAQEIEALEFASSLCLPISLNGSSLLSHSVNNSFHSKSNPQPSGKE